MFDRVSKFFDVASDMSISSDQNKNRHGTVVIVLTLTVLIAACVFSVLLIAWYAPIVIIVGGVGLLVYFVANSFRVVYKEYRRVS